MFAAKILLDSKTADVGLSTAGYRLTTMEVTYPRIIHAERLRHRMFSASVASSRAIPVEKTLRQVETDPFIPYHWGAAQKGMQADNQIDADSRGEAIVEWLTARDNAVASARRMLDLGLHKQVINRVLEPFTWITEIISSTTWTNFFQLRIHPAAEPHIRLIAQMMRDALNASTPTLVPTGMWHMPMLREEDASLPPEVQRQVSVARCARISYLTHDGRRDISEDIRLYNQLVELRHFSPLESCATPAEGRHANFFGWQSLRNLMETSA